VIFERRTPEGGRDKRRGGTRWGNRATREVFPPLVRLTQHESWSVAVQLVMSRSTQVQSALRVAEHPHRAASCAAPHARRRRRGGQTPYCGVSDHAIWPLGLPSARPRRWSLTPRCLCLSRSRSSSDACVRAMSKARGSASSTPAVARRLCGSQLARSRRSAPQRFAPPALRAADGLDRASRDPFSATIDGQHGSA
jgi:hypothetical protein